MVAEGRCKAIVRRSISSEQIEIEVVGPEQQRRSYLHELLGVFRDLQRPFENVVVAREIPYENVWLNYDDLLVYEEEKESYFHPVLKKKIPVSDVLNGYARPEQHDEVGKQLNRMEAMLSNIENDTTFLKELGITHTDVLHRLQESKTVREAFFEKIEKGMDSLIPTLPSHDPLVEEIKKFKSEPEVKTKIKLAMHLLFFTVENEISWDMKAVFREMYDDFKNGHIFIKP